MSKKMLGLTAMIAAAVLLIAAVLLPLVIVPRMQQLPDDVDVERTYEGTMRSLLNAEALATGDVGALFINDAPVEISRHVTVEATDGEDALVVEQATATLQNGGTVADLTEVYSVNRRTMRHSDSFSDDDRIDAREGLVIGWPIGTEASDEIGWSGDIQSAVPVTYDSEATVEGMDVYVFTTEVQPTAITDPDVLAQLPPALPKQLLTQLLMADPDALPVPAAQASQILDALPDPVPLTYLYSGSTTYFVEPTTGVIVDLQRSETRAAALTIEGMPDPVLIAAVFDWEYAQSDASIADAVADAEDGRAQLQLFGTIVPIVLLVLGMALMVIGILMRRPATQDSQEGDPSGPAASSATSSDTSSATSSDTSSATSSDTKGQKAQEVAAGTKGT